jgi:hypothetical protein
VAPAFHTVNIKREGEMVMKSHKVVLKERKQPPIVLKPIAIPEKQTHSSAVSEVPVHHQHSMSQVTQQSHVS